MAPVQGRPFLTAAWRDLLMINWAVDPALLMPHLPRGVELDAWEGRHFVSLVGFQFLDTRLWGVPIPFHQKFCEVNLRFYVRRRTAQETRRGVVFIREIVARRAVTALARWLYNENYHTLPMRADVALRNGGCHVEYAWRDRAAWGHLAAESTAPWQAADPAAQFITEHYWGYTRQRDGGTMEYRVDHPVWRVRPPASFHVQGEFQKLYGDALGHHLQCPPDSAFIAEGSTVAVFCGQRLREHG